MGCQTLSGYHLEFPTWKRHGGCVMALDLNDSGAQNRNG